MRRSYWYSSTRRPAAQAWVAVVGLLLAGCLENYGRLAPSLEVTRQFETARVLTDYHYYSYGGSSSPRAIMGIHQDYRLTSRNWTPLPKLTAEMLKKKVSGMDTEMERMSQTCGGVLYGPDGQQVGVWYSKSRRTTIHLDESGGVSVSPPRLEEEERRLFFIP